MVKVKRETRWGLLAIPQNRRKEFDQLIPKLNFEMVEYEVSGIESNLGAIMDSMLENLFQFNRKTLKHAFDYGFHGNFSGFSSPNLDGSRTFDPDTFTGALEALFYINKFIEVFGSDYEVESSLSIIAILNAVSARSVLDRHKLDGLPGGHLSIQEIALLARMREVSVRNAAAPSGTTPLATKKHEEGLTIVVPEEAERWLLDRRGFQATTFPSSEEEKKKLYQGLDNWVLTS
jgi:hypothetical protein